MLRAKPIPWRCPSGTKTAEPFSMLAQALLELAGTHLVDDDGASEVLELLPPATDREIADLEDSLSVPLPTELREALRVSTGFVNGPLESLSLLDLAGFGMDDVFPEPYSIGHDGFGNYWILDLLPDRDECGPVYYACHDPPVIAYQSATPADFLRDVVALWQDGPRSPVDVVHDDVASSIWASKAGLTGRDALDTSGDPVLLDFAAGFPPETVFADLRSATVGEGFAWGRYGPRTEWTRAGTHRLWATVPPTRRGLLDRIFGRGRS
jgi:hypothetical protein